MHIEPLSKEAASVLKPEADVGGSKEVSEELLRIRSLRAALPPTPVQGTRKFSSLKRRHRHVKVGQHRPGGLEAQGPPREAGNPARRAQEQHRARPEPPVRQGGPQHLRPRERGLVLRGRPRGELRRPAPEPPLGGGLGRLLGGDRPGQGHRHGPEGGHGEVRLRDPKGRREAPEGAPAQGDRARGPRKASAGAKVQGGGARRHQRASSSPCPRSTTGPSRRWRSSSPSRRGSSRS